MVNKIPGCDPTTRFSIYLHNTLQLSIQEECEKFIKCALKTDKIYSKDSCIDGMRFAIQYKCETQAKKLGKDIKKCEHVLKINKKNANFIGHEYFNNSFRKYRGIIKYYDFPSFKDTSIKLFECYLGDLSRGFDKECENDESFFIFYELPNGKFVIENDDSLASAEFLASTKCVKGMEVPELDNCNFEDEDQQYDIKFIKEGEDLDDDDDGVFIENFGMFVEVIVIEEFNDLVMNWEL